MTEPTKKFWETFRATAVREFREQSRLSADSLTGRLKRQFVSVSLLLCFAVLTLNGLLVFLAERFAFAPWKIQIPVGVLGLAIGWTMFRTNGRNTETKGVETSRRTKENIHDPHWHPDCSSPKRTEGRLRKEGE